MPRQIDVEVDRRGQVKVEFSGFPGEACYDEAEILRKALQSLGLWAIPVTVTPKSQSEIQQELGQEQETQAKRKVPLS